LTRVIISKVVAVEAMLHSCCLQLSTTFQLEAHSRWLAQSINQTNFYSAKWTVYLYRNNVDERQNVLWWAVLCSIW